MDDVNPQKNVPAAAVTPRRKRFRRILLKTALVFFPLFGIFVSWLLWPMSDMPGSLLGMMPSDMTFGVEIRNPDELWREADRMNLPMRIMHGGGLTDSLFALAESCVQSGSDEKRAKIDALRSRLKQFEPVWKTIGVQLDYPFGLKLMGRALRGNVAVASHDLKGTDAVLYCRTNNYSLLLAHLAVLFKGKPAVGGMPRHIVCTKGGVSKYLAVKGRFIIAATSEKRLESALKSLSSPRSIAGKTAFRSPSLLLWAKPDTSMRGALANRLSSGFYMFDEFIASVWPEGKGFKVTSRGFLNAKLAEVLREESAARRKRALTLAPETSVALPANREAPFSCSGWMNPEFSWYFLSKKLWDESARPLRGVNRPASVFLWDLLDRGVIAHADGRFALSFKQPEVLLESKPDDSGVPPAVGICAFWGVGEVDVAAQEFLGGIRRMVDYYRAPGGSGLYQEVREYTEVKPAEGGRAGQVRLHPLFFNHMNPKWRFDGKTALFTNIGKLSAPVFEPMRKIRPKDGEQVIALVNGKWSADEKIMDALGAFFADKAIKHGFAPDSARTRLDSVQELMKSVLFTFPAGAFDVYIKRKHTTESTGVCYEFGANAVIDTASLKTEKSE